MSHHGSFLLLQLSNTFLRIVAVPSKAGFNPALMVIHLFKMEKAATVELFS